MKKKFMIIVGTLFFVGIASVLMYYSGLLDINNREKVELLDEKSWISQEDGTQHTICTYTLGKEAAEIELENPNYTMEHLSIDGAYLYYYHTSEAENEPLIIFLHGQGSEKEEYLTEFQTYAAYGFSCITLDLEGHGERTSESEISALTVTVTTSEDLDRILDYFSVYRQSFVLFGISQGGSVAYHYAAYGKYTPSALIVASTSPDFVDAYDNSIIQDGKIIGQSNAEKLDSDDFIEANNPILQWEKIVESPILSGNVAGDTVVPVAGSQELEKLCIDYGVSNATFLYFAGDAHDVPESFFLKIESFLSEYIFCAQA